MKNTNRKAETAPANGHTPGPWKTCRQLRNTTLIDVWTDRIPVPLVGQTHIATIDRNLNTQASFNAALIASAPALIAERDRLKAALQDLFALMDEGWLIRDTSEDAKPGFAMRQIEPVRRLAKARAALAASKGGK